MARNLILSPVTGSFDTAAIQGYLEAQPDVFADPQGTGIYVITGLPEAVPNKESARQKDPSRFPRAGYVCVKPDSIHVDQEMADAEELRSILQFLKWMWERFEFSARDDYGQDFTDRVRSEGVEHLYSNSVRSMPAPWANRLIKVGFFQELDHGDDRGPSLKEKRSDTPASDERRIADYLGTGHVLIASSEDVNDWLADDPDITIGPPHILTDGTYAWPADLPYYVRNYHVRLPKHFVLHAARNDFHIPAHVDVASLKLE
jgi:hypothetical protein